MAITVYRQLFDPAPGTYEIDVIEGVGCLTAREHLGQVAVFFHHEICGETVKRKISIVGTGDPSPHPDLARYLGTATFDSGYELHVFERAD